MDFQKGRLAIAMNLIHLGLIRVDSAANDEFRQYPIDHAYFKANPKLHAMVRRADVCEPFDIGHFPLAYGEKSEVRDVYWSKPQLWCLVINLADVHIVMPIWRGKPFFSVNHNGALALADSDAQVMSVVQQMAQRQGCVAEEWNPFAEKLMSALNRARALSDGSVN